MQEKLVLKAPGIKANKRQVNKKDYTRQPYDKGKWKQLEYNGSTFLNFG